MGFAPFINPFDAKKIAEDTAKRFFFKVDEFENDSLYVADKPLFITTIGGAAKRIEGRVYSPLLTESQVMELQAVFKYNTRYLMFFIWGFWVLPLSFPIVLLTGMNPIVFFILGGLLLAIAYVNFLIFIFQKEKIGNRLHNESVLVPIPDGLRRRSIFNSLKPWAGPVCSSILGQAVDLSKSVELKTLYTGLEIGKELVTFRRK